MKKSRFNEKQIIQILKELESGIAASELCRKYGLGNSTIYTWRTRYAGMTESDLRRLRELEEENSRLKRMYADLSLDHTILKDVVAKKLQA